MQNIGNEEAALFTFTHHSIFKLQKGDVIQLVLTCEDIYDDDTSNTQLIIEFLMREF